MQSLKPPFAVKLFEACDSESRDLEAAIAIYNAGVSPLLKTKTNEIRWKVAHPREADSTFRFAALYRFGKVVGFAMFGHYPSSRLVVIDHMAIDASSRSDSAFFVFAQHLIDFITAQRLEVDFAVIELEKEGMNGDQTGGSQMVRLLSHFRFGEVHADYSIADMEPIERGPRHAGILLLRAPTRLARMQRRDLLRIYRSVLFEHYLYWCRSFLGPDTARYETYLKGLYAEFEKRLPDGPVLINGPEKDGLLTDPGPKAVSREGRTASYAVIFSLMSLPLLTVLHLFGASMTESVAIVLVLVMAFAAVVLISEGGAREVFENTLNRLPGGTRTPRYPRLPRTEASGKAVGRRHRDDPSGSDV